MLTEIGDMLGGIKKHLVNFVVKHSKMVPEFNLKQTIPFKQVIAANPADYKPEINLDDLAFPYRTGGTTGVSKGNAHSWQYGSQP